MDETLVINLIFVSTKDNQLLKIILHQFEWYFTRLKAPALSAAACQAY